MTCPANRQSMKKNIGAAPLGRIRKQMAFDNSYSLRRNSKPRASPKRRVSEGGGLLVGVLLYNGFFEDWWSIFLTISPTNSLLGKNTTKTPKANKMHCKSWSHDGSANKNNKNKYFTLFYHIILFSIIVLWTVYATNTLKCVPCKSNPSGDRYCSVCF